MKVPDWLKPLITDRKTGIFWVSIVVLLIVKIYQGDHSFFTTYFGDSIHRIEYLKWAKWGWHHGASLILFFAIPALIVRAGFKASLGDYGLKVGDWKFGLKATSIAFVIMPFVVYASSLDPSHKAFYSEEFPLQLATSGIWYFLLWSLTYLPHYIGWEFFFRGYIGLGVKPRSGAFVAVMIQVLLTTLMHIGKPQGETIGAALGGVYLGLLTYRTGSVWYAILFHWYLGILNSLFCSF